MSKLLALLVAALVLAACGVPEVDLELPDRSGNVQNPVDTPGSQDPGSPSVSPDDATDSSAGDPGTATSEGVPDPEELDELEQLVSEIEALLEGVSGELEQITFEEEGG